MIRLGVGLKVLGEKGRELVPRDQVHAVVEINMTGIWNDGEFPRF